MEGSVVDSAGCVEHVGLHAGGLWKAVWWIVPGV